MTGMWTIVRGSSLLNASRTARRRIDGSNSEVVGRGRTFGGRLSAGGAVAVRWAGIACSLTPPYLGRGLGLIRSREPRRLERYAGPGAMPPILTISMRVHPVSKRLQLAVSVGGGENGPRERPGG